MESRKYLFSRGEVNSQYVARSESILFGPDLLNIKPCFDSDSEPAYDRLDVIKLF